MTPVRPLLSLAPHPARHFRRLIFPAAVVIALAAGQAHAVDRNAYSMEVLVNGVPLREYQARGTTYVEALEGAEYSIRLSNRTGERVAVALAVDGLNSIDAKSTNARHAQKWILAPWETVVLDGWQTSGTTARRFFFTTERDSYGAWLGKTKNLGVISAVVFREKRLVALPISPAERDDPAAGARREAAPGAADANEARASDDLAATGIGREVDHAVRRVDFDSEDSPAAVLDLRYEYHDALVRLGVLPARCHPDDALARRERARGFDGLEFAPDPFRRRR